MKLIQPTIAPDSAGDEVKNLHYVLYFFKQRLDNGQINQFMDDAGFLTTYKEEVFQSIFKDATRKLVSVFQESLQIAGNHGVVDEPTTQRFNALLQEFGGLAIAIPDGYPFEVRTMDETRNNNKVSGFVLSKSGEYIPRQQVVAYDVDLAGVKILKQVGKQDDLANGFEFLGEATSNADGYYAISFTKEKFSKAELARADVVVFAVNPDKKITGRSSLSTKADYDDENQLTEWNVIVDDEKAMGETEYKFVMSVVAPFMEQNQLALHELADSTDQIAFVASETELPAQAIDLIVGADLLKKTVRRRWDIS